VYRPDFISKPSPIGQGAKLRVSAKAYMNRAEELFSRIE